MDPLIPSGQPAPDFCLPGLDGSSYCLKEWRARVVIINFWSAECPWAQRADRALLSYLPAWGEAVALWSIASNANEPVDSLARVAAQRGVPLVLHDGQHEVADLYGAQTTPHLFVVDAEGILRYQGAVDDVTFRQRSPTHFYLQKALEAILSGSQPDPAQTPPYGCTIVRYAP